MSTKRKWWSAIGLISLLGLPMTNAAAGLIGYVKLDHISRVIPAGGGGLSQFQIDGYLGADGNATASEIFGPAGTGSYVYATCMEYDQTWSTSSTWYAIYDNLVGQPSATGNINGDEAALIERVLTTEFGTSFDGTESQADIAALQALVWEAGEGGDPLDDFSDGDVAGRGTGGASTAEGWIGTYAAGLDQVTAYALVTQGRSNDGSFYDLRRQDFMTYLPSADEAPPIPVPAPILLTGIGLLGLHRFSRKRA